MLFFIFCTIFLHCFNYYLSFSFKFRTLSRTDQQKTPKEEKKTPNLERGGPNICTTTYSQTFTSKLSNHLSQHQKKIRKLILKKSPNKREDYNATESSL